MQARPPAPGWHAGYPSRGRGGHRPSARRSPSAPGQWGAWRRVTVRASCPPGCHRTCRESHRRVPRSAGIPDCRWRFRRRRGPARDGRDMTGRIANANSHRGEGLPVVTESLRPPAGAHQRTAMVRRRIQPGTRTVVEFGSAPRQDHEAKRLETRGRGVGCCLLSCHNTSFVLELEVRAG